MRCLNTNTSAWLYNGLAVCSNINGLVWEAQRLRGARFPMITKPVPLLSLSPRAREVLVTVGLRHSNFRPVRCRP